MFENIAAGWKLGSAVRKVVFKDKKVFIFPIIASIILLIETIAIFFPMFIFNSFNSYSFIIGLFIYYIAVYFTATYLLVAMLISFRSFSIQKPIKFSEAFSQTSNYIVQIFEWAVFEATITMVIRAIEQRLGFIGSMIFGLGASIAMSIATAFAVPVIIDKKEGPISTLKNSTSFILKNFGKTFGGLIYADLYSLALFMVGIVLLMVSAFVFTAIQAAGIILAIIGLVLIVFGLILGYILSNIYKFILYEYMNGGKLPEEITEDMVKLSIKANTQKQSNGIFGGSSSI
jgi:hypothetical protein